MAKTKIKNLSNFTISINLPGVRFARDIAPGQEVTIPDEDVLDEFNYDPGCRSFVKDGFLQVIAPSSELQAEVVKAEATTAAEVDIEDLLKNQPISKLSAILKSASPALKDSIVAKAIELSIADAPHCNIIKAFTGIDIINAIQLRHDN